MPWSQCELHCPTGAVKKSTPNKSFFPSPTLRSKHPKAAKPQTSLLLLRLQLDENVELIGLLMKNSTLFHRSLRAWCSAIVLSTVPSPAQHQRLTFDDTKLGDEFGEQFTKLLPLMVTHGRCVCGKNLIPFRRWPIHCVTCCLTEQKRFPLPAAASCMAPCCGWVKTPFSSLRSLSTLH